MEAIHMEEMNEFLYKYYDRCREVQGSGQLSKNITRNKLYFQKNSVVYISTLFLIIYASHAVCTIKLWYKMKKQKQKAYNSSNSHIYILSLKVTFINNFSGNEQNTTQVALHLLDLYFYYSLNAQIIKIKASYFT